jgi:hypothetical protein
MTEPKSLSAEVDSLKAIIGVYITDPVDLASVMVNITISLVEQQHAGWVAGQKLGKALANVAK